MKPIIEVCGLYKKYKKGQQTKYLSLRDTLVKLPRLFSKQTTSLKESEFWALKNVTFDVNQGEALGIIGGNGAGKSTILKVLSRITPPTRGNITLRGRLASLLEVGTGFHQELTGRENIFLNGAILGMTRREIKSKFDEIVDFSGIETFLDTPVKHYSSGMYMRLAFAVAAHLEPEILLIDEVLAVGDAAFQKKCLGKISQVTTQEGRTVLFISHNLGAIQNLCQRSLYIDKGIVKAIGPTSEIVKLYLHHKTDLQQIKYTFKSHPDIKQQLRSIEVTNTKNEPSSHFDIFEPIKVHIEYEIKTPIIGAHIGISLTDQRENYIFFSSDTDNNPRLLAKRRPGIYQTTFSFFPPHDFSLNQGTYYFRVTLGIPDGMTFDEYSNIEINLHDPATRRSLLRNGTRPGILLYDTHWISQAMPIKTIVKSQPDRK